MRKTKLAVVSSTPTEATEMKPTKKRGRKANPFLKDLKDVLEKARRYQSLMDAWEFGGDEKSWIKVLRLLRKFDRKAIL